MIHYLIKTSESYISSAGYNRVRLISEGLIEGGADVKIHLLIVSRWRSKLMRGLERYLFSYFKHLCKLLLLWWKVDKRDVVIIYSELDHYWLFPLFNKKTNLILEKTEYPSFEIDEKIRKVDAFISKQNLNYMKYASALITCSSYLERYYSRYVGDIFIIPLVVNIGEYNKLRRTKSSEIGEYIAYCGNFNNNKDGIPILIDAFKIFHDTHSHFKLVLIGSGGASYVNEFKNQITRNGIAESVLFTGALKHGEVGEWLAGATMLALARPNNKQAEGGIPSKVGEYLACGVPCVITKTGDLPGYLNHGVDCFLAQPNSSKSFAHCLEECYLADRDNVGMMAQKAAAKFDYIVQTRKLLFFIKKKYGVDVLYSGKCRNS